jgi:hypothetical protein
MLGYGHESIKQRQANHGTNSIFPPTRLCQTHCTTQAIRLMARHDSRRLGYERRYGRASLHRCAAYVGEATLDPHAPGGYLEGLSTVSGESRPFRRMLHFVKNASEVAISRINDRNVGREDRDRATTLSVVPRSAGSRVRPTA